MTCNQTQLFLLFIGGFLQSIFWSVKKNRLVAFTVKEFDNRLFS